MDGRGDRRARIAVSAMFFVDGAALAGYVSHLADIQAKLHLTNGGLGRAILFSGLGAITTMPLAGPLIHRFGSRLLTLVGLGALLAVLLLLMIAPSLPLLCLTLYCIGLTNGQADVAMNTHSMAVQDRFARPILSAIHGWFSLGGFAGAAGTALAARLGGSPETHMAVASVVLAIIVGFAGMEMLPWDTDKHADPPRLALPNRRTLFLGLLVVCAFVAEGSMWDWSTVFLRHVRHSGPEFGALGFAFASFGMALGRFLGDRWTHRFGYVPTLFGSSLLSAAGLLAAVQIPNLAASVVAFGVMGLGVANLVPLLFRAAAQVPGLSAGTGLSIVTTCGYGGFLAGPPLLGLIADRRGLGFALSLCGLLCLTIAFAARPAVGRLDAHASL